MYLFHKPRLEAAAMLQEARAGRLRLGYDGWYDLTLLATGDEEEAAQAANAYARAELRAGRQPM